MTSDEEDEGRSEEKETHDHWIKSPTRESRETEQQAIPTSGTTSDPMFGTLGMQAHVFA